MSERLSIALDGMLLGGKFTGVEQAIAGLAQALAESGNHRYSFYVPGSCPLPDPRGEDFTTERIRIPRSRLARLIWEQRKLPAILKAGTYDLLHAPAYLAPLSVDLPVVLTVYDLQALLHPHLCLPLNRLNYRLMLPRSIGKAGGIIVPSESVGNEVRSLFPDIDGKIRVIPIGVNREFRVIGTEEQAAALASLGVSTPFILFVGNMAPNKNLLTLVRAFGLMKRDRGLKHQLVLAGSRARQYASICRLIMEEGLEEEVIWTGHVPMEQLVGLYNAAEAFVFPSIYEGFGLPPLEAMSCGTPVVCANAGACAEVAGPAAVMVDPHDSAAMAKVVADLIENKARRDELREKGLKRAGEFTWDRTRSETEAFYAEVMSCR